MKLKSIFLLLCMLALANVKAQNLDASMLTYKLLCTEFADSNAVAKSINYTVWKVDTVAKKIYWYYEKGTLNDYYQSKVSNIPLRVLAFQIINKSRWQIDYKPDKIDNNGGEEFGYGMIKDTKIYADKIEIYEKYSYIKPYFYYENNKANELTKLFVKNPTIVKVAKHWVKNFDTPKTENPINYQWCKDDIKKTLGRHLYFGLDGSFVDTYFTPCGLDGNIHKYNGKWKLNNKNRLWSN